MIILLITYLIHIFAFLALWTHFVYVLIKRKRWNSELVNSEIIKRNTGSILVYGGLIVFCVVYLVIYRNLTGIPELLKRYMTIHWLLWANLCLFLSIYSYFKPKITVEGIVYNGRFYKWNKINHIEYNNNCIKMHVTSRINDLDAKIRVRDNPELIVDKIKMYIEKPSKSEVVHSV